MAIKTFTAGAVLTASDTNTFLANASANYITGAAFSITNASPLNVNSVFTSTFDNYFLLLQNLTGTGTAEVLLQWRAGSTTTTSGYFTAYVGLNSAGSAYNSANNGSAAGITVGLAETAAGSGSARIDLFTPNSAGQAAAHGNIFAQGPGFYATRQGGGALNAGTDFDGFTLRASAGTITGSYALYGYRKA